MPNTTTVIVEAGHCGLAMSRCLAARSVDHVVLERGDVANSWRTQRWDSLRLLTPNWMTRLPGYAYRGADPDGYLSARQVTAMLADYADASVAPVLTGVTVTSVRAAGGGYVVRTRWAMSAAPPNRKFEVWFSLAPPAGDGQDIPAAVPAVVIAAELRVSGRCGGDGRPSWPGWPLSGRRSGESSGVRECGKGICRVLCIR